MLEHDVDNDDTISISTNTPIDDSRLKKRIGFVSADYSECLILIRKGKVSPKSGNGARVFRLPWDSISIVPISIKQISMSLGELSNDGVQLLVKVVCHYRIKDAIKLATLINFSRNREAAEAKCANLVGSNVRAVVKDYVSRLPHDQILKNRQEKINTPLELELAPRFEAIGIEIQSIYCSNVYIASDEIYEAMQSERRIAEVYSAREKELAAETRLAERKLERESELNELRTEKELRNARLKHAIEQEDALLNQERELKELENQRIRNELEHKVNTENQQQALILERETLAFEAEKTQAQVANDKTVNEQKLAYLLSEIQTLNQHDFSSLSVRFIQDVLPLYAKAHAEGLKGANISILQDQTSNGGDRTLQLGMLELKNLVEKFCFKDSN